MPIGIKRTGIAGQRNRDATSRHDHLPPRGRGQQVTTNGVANAKRQYERYLALARSAASTADATEIENLYQHAEHYFRLMRKQTA